MMNSNICYTANLVAEDDLTQVNTQYKVIDLKNALDINGFMDYMGTLGYIKRQLNARKKPTKTNLQPNKR